MRQKIKNHFQRVDPALFRVLREVEPLEEVQRRSPRDYFSSLCVEIINQQLSNKAAAAIVKRFTALFPRRRITAEKVLQLSDATIRDVGTSWAKARYIKDLAQKVEAREVVLSHLPKLDDQSAIEELTKIKGIGTWTAEMFLIFSLGREDIFSFGDLGLRRAVEHLYNLENPTREQVANITHKWAPYRSWASRVLWKWTDG